LDAEGVLVDSLASCGKDAHRGESIAQRLQRGELTLDRGRCFGGQFGFRRGRHASGGEHRIESPEANTGGFWSSIARESIAQQCEQNTGWKPMLHYAVALLLRVHGDSSERSLDSPKTISIGRVYFTNGILRRNRNPLNKVCVPPVNLFGRTAKSMRCTSTSA
jgi:hypothetical protein